MSVSRSGRALRAAFVAAGCLSFVAGASDAATKTWIGGNSTWSGAGNWNPAGVPAAGDQALLFITGNTATYDASVTPVNLLAVSVSNGMTLAQTGGTLATTATSSIAGTVGAATYSISGGVGTFNQLNLGASGAQAANGSLLMSGGSIIVNGNFNIGGSSLSSATALLNAGADLRAGTINMGLNALGNNVLRLNAGATLTAGTGTLEGQGRINLAGSSTLVITDNSFSLNPSLRAGTLQMNGGTIDLVALTFRPAVSLWNHAGGVLTSSEPLGTDVYIETGRTYSLSGGTIASQVRLRVEGGTFTQTGGVYSGRLLFDLDGQGTLQNGTITAGDFYIARSSFRQLGGVMTIGPAEATIAGTFDLVGGTLNANWIGLVGGTFLVSGGTATGGVLVVDGSSGYPGDAVLSGGTVSFSTVEVGAEYGGTLTLNGTRLIATDFHLNGNRYPIYSDLHSGTVIHSSGTVTTSQLSIANEGSAHSYYTLGSGGWLGASSVVFVGEVGAGTLTHSGGTAVIAGPGGGDLVLGSSSSSFGRYILSSGSLSVGRSTTVALAGVGSFSQTGGTHAVGNGVPDGSLAIGATTDGRGTYDLSGGTLTVAGVERIGVAGLGTFLQSGGMHVVGAPASPRRLEIGSMPGGAGTVIISGSGVSVVNGDAFLGGSSNAAGGAGVLNVSGATFTVTGSLRVWDIPNTLLELSGGNLSVGALNLSGNPARFNWTSGTLAITASSLSIGSGGQLGSSVVLDSAKSLGAQSALVQNGASITVLGGNLSTGSFSNSGEVVAINGRVVASGASTNTAGAKINMIGGTLSLGTGANRLTNSGRINLIDTTVSGDIANAIGGTIDTAGSVTFNGAITGGGVFLVGNRAVLAAGAIANDPSRLSRAGSLSIGSAAALDLANNSFVLDYTGASPFALIRNQIATGRNGGDWQGTGIRSSAAAGEPRTSLGIVEAATVGSPPVYLGQTIDDTTVLIRYTLAGDGNIDGTVSIADFSLLASNFNLLTSSWLLGDYDYNGITGISDFALLATNFNQSLPADSARSSSVPEPVSVGLALLLGAHLIRCRRALR